jgi:hypothetical protein
MILVDNPNRAGVEVLVDGEFVGKVGSDSTARFGPFSRGDHKVVTRFRCKKRHLTLRTSLDVVELRRGRPSRLQVPFAEKGIVDLENDWVQPMRVYVDGRSVGTVRAGDVLSAFAGRGDVVEMRDPRGHTALRERPGLRGLESVGFELNPPARAYVTITNPGPRRVRVDLGGREQRIRAGASAEFFAPTGWTAMTATHRGRTIDQQKVMVSPFAEREYVVRLPKTATLRFQNDNRVSVTIYGPRGRYLGRAGAGRTVTLPDVAVGRFDLEVVARLRSGTVRDRLAVSIDPFEGGWVTSRIARRDGRGAYRSRRSADVDSCDTRTSRRSSRRRGYYASR